MTASQPQYLPDIHHFHVEATLDTTDDDSLNNLDKTSLECRNQRTNGSVNAHLISEQIISTKAGHK